MSDPLLSLVVPVYDVATWVPDFLGSLATQRATEVEVVFVDDGSTDGSGDLIRAWCADAPFVTRVERQENAGLAAARNTGLALARGQWVSFPDPDDVLADGYLGTVTAALAGLDDSVSLAAARILVLRADGMVSDTHPLRAKFDGGSRTVDLDETPDLIQLQAASAFLRRAVLVEAGLTFDGTVRPNFEDAYLIAHYLAGRPRRTVALLADAHYVYRRRSDGTSLVQQSWAKEEKYTLLPRTAYLRLLQDLGGDGRPAPRWLQNLVLYDLLWYFREDQRMHAATAAVSPETSATFHDLVEQILALVEDEMLLGFSVVETSSVLRRVLLIGYKHPHQVPAEVHVRRIDVAQQIAQVRYLYGPAADPVEEFVVGGVVSAPVHTKVRDHTYFGRTLAYERIAWLPATASLRLVLDGRQVPLRFGTQPDVVLTAEPDRMWAELTRQAAPVLRTEPARPAAPPPPPSPGLSHRLVRRARRSRAGRLVARRVIGRWRRRTAVPQEPTPAEADRRLRERAREPETVRRFGRAWAFLDRDTMAQDNAEHLYRWVRAHRPEVNAWFVLRADSPDWDRLLADGFALVDPGTDDYVLLMLNTRHRISSQADHYVVAPLDPERFGPARGRFTFLQHGVIKDDLSRWLNFKRISLFITTTPDEYASIAGDHTPYLFTSKEVAMTGLPRHDRLLALSREPGHRPRWLLLAPTWRRDLFEEAVDGNERSTRAGLWESPYWQAWLGVMCSPELRAYADAAGLQVAFLPHPNLDAHITSGLPEHVALLHYAGADVQQTIVDAAVMITDYSSLAFEAAYLGRPVAYYHYDAGSIFAGGHIGRRGPWSYVEHGFGPVAEDLPALVAALHGLVVSPEGPAPAEPYAQRMADTFVFRDGRCCERVYDAIVRLGEPHPEAATLTPRAPVPPVVIEPYAHPQRS